MPRNKDKPFPVIEPDVPVERGAHRQAIRQLVESGWDAPNADWLAGLLLKVLPACGSTESQLSDTTEAHVLHLALTKNMYGEGDRDAALLLMLAALTGCVWIPRLVVPQEGAGQPSEIWSVPESRWAEVVDDMRRHGADFERVLRAGWPKHLISEWSRDASVGVCDRAATFMRLLLQSNAIDLTKVVDIEKMRHSGRDGRWWPASFLLGPNGQQWMDGTAWLDPRSFRTWVWQLGSLPLHVMAKLLQAEPTETIVAFVTAAAQAATTRFANSEYGCQFECFEGHTPDWVPTLREFARAMRPYFEELDRRVVEKGKDVDPRLRSAWMLLFRMAWDSEAADCPAEVRKRVLDAATEDLSRARSLFGPIAVDAADNANRFLQHLPHIERCCKLLAFHRGLWRCMKPLLLALRALRTPALARDLRYWEEFADDPPPTPWNAIPGLLNTMFHAYAGREQRADPDLGQLRGRMATYLLERLTDRWSQERREAAITKGQARTDDDMTEPAPEWRYCMIRAVVDLRVNPEGKGHRALHWSSTHDPDPRVREAAKSASQTLRHQRGLPQGTSPRRALMSALWWLKQAHMLGLGIQPDPDGAQRTRAKELTRTKEVERDDNPADSKS